MEWEVSNNEFILNELLNGRRNNIDTSWYKLIQVDTSWYKLMPQVKKCGSRPWDTLTFTHKNKKEVFF